MKATVDMIKPRPFISRRLAMQGKATKKQFEQLKSTSQAEALHIKNFQLDPIYPQPRATSLQLQWMNGELPFDQVGIPNPRWAANSYPDSIYRDLCQSLKELRDQQNRMATPGPKRRKLATKELQAWLDFVDRRREMLEGNPDFSIDPVTHIKLKDQFDRFKDRTHARVPTEKITEVHEAFAGNFRFKVPINPKNLAQIINPYQGYMANFKPGTKFFSWAQMQQVYDINIIASYEKTQGRSLLGDELACLSFWLLQDQEKKGYLEMDELLELMYAFRFTNITNTDEFTKEFAFELKQEHFWIPEVNRFDLARRIFLNRGL